ncbi:hypothetical protein ACFFS2_35150 [Streptomyces aurantiacus]|uniref:Lipoprotein n=1 Tax=Streptomyces aurantiacus TaxID=47760 RepID=A0A7G1P6P0_9ACTN|nr:hypothetical protein [Streptomyces aurantiacus]BCL29476.1 hypothetical protein GCM10017557_43350 [Streptomyces aurantiacus]
MLNRPPRRHRRTAPTLVPALAPALMAAALLTTAGCSGGDRAGAAGDAAASGSAVAARAPSPSPSVTVAPTLTEAQAKSALVTAADLGDDDWTPTRGAATWRDALLKGTADVAGCQRLLDGLYAEDLLGRPAGARAVTGFDHTDRPDRPDRPDDLDDTADTDGSADTDGTADEVQLRYQVGAYDRAALDASLAWVKAVPTTCGQFTATNAKGGQFTVRAVAASLPGSLGDAREGLRVTVNDDNDDNGAGLTLDFAAVRVGDSALSFTHGGLDDIDAEDTRQAARAGTRRLQEALAGRTPAAPTSPSSSSSPSGSPSTSPSGSASASAQPSAEQS